jgi:hypothetical protein
VLSIFLVVLAIILTSVFCHTIGAEPPHPSSLPCIGPRASPDFAAAPRPEGLAPSPSLSSGAVNRVGELYISVVHPPHHDLVPWTMLGRCTAGHGCTPWTPSHSWSSLAAPCHALRTVWTLTWSVHGPRFGPRHDRRCPIARVNHRAQLGCRVAMHSERAWGRACCIMHALRSNACRIMWASQAGSVLWPGSVLAQ